ncbi:MAG: ATP-binding cassette domain-containing protein [Candidatus Poseidoniaceae archaeon]|nr:ATP-binding cassette domain-containing protein [Candidatus Poseidoniaceae archaeon]
METKEVLKIENMCKSFGDANIIDGLQLSLAANEIVAILGPSGCGKSTLLRSIVGLETIDQGTIEISSSRKTDAVGYLFQKPILYPHLNVAGNIALGLTQKKSKQEKRAVIAEELAFVDMNGFEKRRVESLSGGEAQRVALVRAMLGQPDVLLLDEPFSALDLDTRRDLAVETRRWLKDRKTAAIHVTHDPEEAELIADRVILWADLFTADEEE